MMKDERKPFKIIAIYDTETTNIDSFDEKTIQHIAFPNLFILNRVRGISDYAPNVSDNIKFMRHSQDMIIELESIVDEGLQGGFIPVVCAYNLMFDLQPLLYELSQRYEMQVNAQNRVSVYTLDLLLGDSILLRFWETFYLEMGGLASMGETCGFAKATGDWNYDLIRHCETPLTDNEIGYAKRDVQVIPAYLRWILETNPHLEESDLGCRVLTKTSLVRQRAKRELSNLKFQKANGKSMSIGYAFNLTCKQELAKDFETYALRKSCFRGGFTFTASKFAMIPVENVASLDVVSMHHAFINGRYAPVHFRRMNMDVLQNLIDATGTYTIDDVLTQYHQPFPFAFHVKCRLKNVRLRKGSAFERWGIALLAMSKFARIVKPNDDSNENLANIAAYNNINSRFGDVAIEPVFAFGKLYAAREIIVSVNELELWNIFQVYDFDSVEALEGEATYNFVVPPDYITLQSNVLFEMKSAMKAIARDYRENTLYEGEISDLIPATIAQGLKTGTLSEGFIKSYYTSTIKGQFNGIYGTQAQDIFKPSFIVEDGIIDIDESTLPDNENFAEMIPERCNVLYTFGERIVAGSRMHIILAIMMLDCKDVDILGGDTDSLKVRCNEDVDGKTLLQRLKPLHVATSKAIDFTQRRLRSLYPELSSNLQDIGCFEVENANEFYMHHMECWNKARISYDSRGMHITCAGLSRPAGKYNIEDAANELMQRYGFDRAAKMVLNFDNWINPELSHSLGHSIPSIQDKFNGDVTDYLGNAITVDEYRSIALYPIGRMLGDSHNNANAFTIDYIGDRIKKGRTILGYDGKEPFYIEL